MSGSSTSQQGGGTASIFVLNFFGSKIGERLLLPSPLTINLFHAPPHYDPHHSHSLMFPRTPSLEEKSHQRDLLVAQAFRSLIAVAVLSDRYSALNYRIQIQKAIE